MTDEIRPYAALEAALGYRFADEALLKRSLTHRSFANERSEPDGGHNERVEFLGDAVVDLSVGHRLMESLPDAREGELSKLRAAVVSEASLARAAHRLELGAYLRLGRGEEQTGGRSKASILADGFEAVIGAVYLDAGFAAADRLVRSLLDGLIVEAVAGDLDRDHKTRLQELAQARHQKLPSYRVVEERGPDHAKEFEVAVSLGDDELARASGHSKKEAEQRAACAALERIART